MPPSEESNNEVTNKEESITSENIIFHCVLNDDQEQLSKVFDDNTHQFFEQGPELINSKNSEGKSPVDMACMLGRTEVLQELIKRGADSCTANSSGYAPLHFASCWGHRSCLETLVQNGINLDLRTNYGESSRQLAVRYKHSDCIEYIDWATAKSTLTMFIAHIRELIADPEKMQGVKLTKEEKSTTLGACNEKQEWVDTTPDATMEDFLLKKDELEKQVELVLNKVNSPAPPTGSSGKK